RQEKRPAGVTPPAFSCNCRFGRSGSAAIPCLKSEHYSIKKILTTGCEVHHGWAEPSGVSIVPIRAASLTGGQHDASLFPLHQRPGSPARSIRGSREAPPPGAPHRTPPS